MTKTEQQSLEYIKERLSDREWRIDNLYHVKDKFGKVVKFIRNPSQRKFWMEMWFLNIILKDRQRGFSTLIAMFILDYCLFNSGTEAGIIDITLEDAQKKLAKISLAYEMLPDFIKEMYPVEVDNKKSIVWKNGSSVSVGTSHRGGTLQLLHISEMGKIAARFPERAREIRTGALNTLAPGNIIFNESTAEGNAGEFFDDCQEAKRKKDAGEGLTKLDYKFHFFAWWEGTENEIGPENVYISPDQDKYFRELEKELGFTLSERKKAWYAKKENQQKGDMKREYPGTPEEAFEAAIEGAYLSKALIKITKKGQITSIPLEHGIPVNTGWDYGLNDNMTIWLHQRVQFTERLIGYLEGSDDDVLYYWNKINRDYDCIWGYHFLPHDFGVRRGGTAKDHASPPKTLEKILREGGMRDTKIIPRIDDKRSAINEVKLWLPKAFIDKKGCDKGLSCLRNFRREWDEANACWKDRPKHDWAMHGYDGLETLVRGLNAYGTIVESQAGVQTRARAPLNWRTA